MQWLWFVAPFLAGLLFVLTGQLDKRALAEIEAWQEGLHRRRSGGRSKSVEKAKEPGKKEKTAYREIAEVPKDAKKKPAAKKKSKKETRPRRLVKLSPSLARMVDLAGGGRPLGDYEIVPKVAFASFVMGDLGGSSDHQTVLVELAEPAPALVARPLPPLDGMPVPNTGIEFRKDPEFGAAYLVEADASRAKAIGKWLTKPLREMLVDAGDVWLRAEGKTLTLSIYGSIRKEKIEALLEIADVFVAEHGAEGGPSLFGEDEEARAARLEEQAGEAEEEELDEEEEELDEDEEDEDEDDDKSAGSARA